MNNSTFEYLNKVFSLLYSEDFKSTISSLASECKVPIEFMRKTVVALLKNEVMYYVFDSSSFDLENINDNQFPFNFSENPVAEAAKTLAGEYDDIPLSVDLKISRDLYLLPLSSLEQGSLATWGKLRSNTPVEKKFEYKSRNTSLSKDEIENLYVITNACQNNYPIEFEYRTKNNIIKKIQCVPQYIFTNVSENLVSFKTNYRDMIYRLDRITGKCRKALNYEHSCKIVPDKNHKYYWGACSSSTETGVTHVKLQIFHQNNPNILSKIERDTAFRSQTRKIYTDGPNTYYEDDIIGRDEFRRWVRSYGSGLCILEPQDLRLEFYERLKEARNQYN